MTSRPEPRKSLPFCFRRTSKQPGVRLPAGSRARFLKYPRQAQPHLFLTPQMQKVRQPTVEEVAVPRFRVKTTGDMSRVWASPSIFDPKSPVPTTSIPSALLSAQRQTPPAIESPISQTPNRAKCATGLPTTPPRRYTPQVTDFALPRHRRYRLSLQWKPQRWDEENPETTGSPLQDIFPITSRGSTWSSWYPRASLPPRRKLIYSLEELPEHPRQGKRDTDVIVGPMNTERTGRSCE
ncbi:hypothetical protein EV426DRAFT_576305 [Tirmania nivea]|nr:hypothetical protein EV426DRAFT_576305 [Tirmania nivea]